MKNRYCLLIVLAFNIMACNKDCRKNNTCPPENYHFTLEGAKDYLWAEKGSFWVYKNTLTNELDTHTCVAYFVDTFISKGNEDYSQHVTIVYEKLFSQMYSSKYKWTITQRTNSFSANSMEPENPRIILIRSIKSGIVECFFFPLELGIHAGNGSYLCEYLGMDSSLLLQGKNFTNVAKFFIDSDGTWGDNPPFSDASATYFWAKDVGLIKRTSTEKPQNWELIEYNIIR